MARTIEPVGQIDRGLDHLVPNLPLRNTPVFVQDLCSTDPTRETFATTVDSTCQVYISSLKYLG